MDAPEPARDLGPAADRRPPARVSARAFERRGPAISLDHGCATRTLGRRCAGQWSSTHCQNSGEWSIYRRCTSSCTITYSPTSGGAIIRRQLSEIGAASPTRCPSASAGRGRQTRRLRRRSAAPRRHIRAPKCSRAVRRYQASIAAGTEGAAGTREPAAGAPEAAPPARDRCRARPPQQRDAVVEPPMGRGQSGAPGRTRARSSHAGLFDGSPDLGRARQRRRGHGQPPLVTRSVIRRARACRRTRYGTSVPSGNRSAHRS